MENRGDIRTTNLLRPRQESNLRNLLRRQVLYPLSYGGIPLFYPYSLSYCGRCWV